MREPAWIRTPRPRLSSRPFVPWPTGPDAVVNIGLSGGRDSRVIFAAAVAAGIEFNALSFAFPNTPGFPDTRDVVVARQVARACDRPLTVEVPRVGSGVRRTARILRLVSDGLVSVGTTGSLTLPEPHVPLPVFLSGQAGDFSRAYYTSDDVRAEKLAEFLYRRAVPAFPKPLVTAAAEQGIRGRISNWVAEHLENGLRAAAVPDLFHVLERAGGWAGAGHAVYECVADVCSPHWAPELLRHQLAATPEERRSEYFHLRLLETLAPELARIGFDQVNPPWPGLRAPRSAVVQRYWSLASQVSREAKRRMQARTKDHAAGSPFLADAVREARHWTNALPDHPAWEVLDRDRVSRLLSRKPSTLDPRSVRQLMSLVSIFAAEDETGPQPR